MGTFGGYSGEGIIKPGKVKEFEQALSKILYYGGMMHIQSAGMYDYELVLLEPVQIEDFKDADFYYNYFEDDSWENAGYMHKDQRFYSNKIGWAEFDDVVTAANCLYEHYDESPGFAHINGEAVDGTECTGWINQLTGKKFTLEHRYDLWRYVETYTKHFHEEGEDIRREYKRLIDILPGGMVRYAGGVDFADLLYIFEGTDQLGDDTEEGYSRDIYACKKAVKKLIEEVGADEAFTKLTEFLKCSAEERRANSDSALDEIARLSLYMPARVFVYLICELEEKDFWEQWKRKNEDEEKQDIKYLDEVYHDEKMKEYASEELKRFREDGRRRPIAPVRTSDFLRQGQERWSLTFHDTPKELLKYGNYYLNDGDRLYWWDGSDEVRIDDACDEWLKKTAERYREHLEKTPVEADAMEFTKSFMKLLHDVDERYKRIFAFSDMFYEFVSNGIRKEYRAATELLREMYDDKDNVWFVQFLKDLHSWDIDSKNIKCCKGRMDIKRYLSLLANKKLRMKYMGF